MPSASIKPPLVNITYNTFRLCHIRFYTFVGHPFLKQLYMRSLAQQGSNPSNFARPISMTRNYDTLSSVRVLPTNINSCSFWRNVQENDHAMFKFVDHKIQCMWYWLGLFINSILLNNIHKTTRSQGHCKAFYMYTQHHFWVLS